MVGTTSMGQLFRLSNSKLTADQLAKMGRPAQILIDSDWLRAGCVRDLRIRRFVRTLPCHGTEERAAGADIRNWFAAEQPGNCCLRAWKS